jgi:hypothetical protein
MVKADAPFQTGDVVQYSTRRMVPGQTSFLNIRVETMTFKQGEWDDYPQWYINGTVLNYAGFNHYSGERVTVVAADFRKID